MANFSASPNRLLATFLALLSPSALATIYKTLIANTPFREIVDRLLVRSVPDAIDLPEGRLLLNKNDAIVSAGIALGIYEQNMIAHFRKMLTPGMVVVDIGANLGLYTLIASETVQTVIAYEPEPVNAMLCEQTMRINNRRNVKVICSGLSDRCETRILFLHPVNKGKHSLIPPETHTQQKNSVRVPLTTLDESLRKEGISRVDLIKLDVEGWEACVIRGMRETLLRDHPILFFEYAPVRIREAGEDPEAMLSFLEEIGYRFALIDEDGGVPRHVKTSRLSVGLRGPDDYVNVLALVDDGFGVTA